MQPITNLLPYSDFSTAVDAAKKGADLSEGARHFTGVAGLFLKELGDIRVALESMSKAPTPREDGVRARVISYLRDPDQRNSEPSRDEAAEFLRLFELKPGSLTNAEKGLLTGDNKAKLQSIASPRKKAA